VGGGEEEVGMDSLVETYGCALNQADSEFIQGLLREQGLEDAGVLVVNTCTVKSPTENKILKRLRRLESEGRKVVVAGCLPAARPSVVDDFPSFSFIGTNVSAVVEAVSAAAAGERYVNITEPGEKIVLPQVKSNPVVGIIPIAEGCLGSCTYCITRSARGVLRSCRVRDVVRRVEESVSDGVRELWVTAQDTGAYGRDIDSSLPRLLNRITEVEGDFRVRVGMMNPHHALEMLDELLQAFREDRIYKFVHVPVQSGSDHVLEDMGRDYKMEDFRLVVDGFRREFNATISTDVITGYPTESMEDFKATVDLIKEVKPDVLNVSRYWARPGTEAALLKQLPGRETKKRSRIVGKVFRETGLERNKSWVGWRGRCVVSEENDDGTYTARNDWYKPIIIGGNDLLGDVVDVEVTEATYYDLRAQLL
jgi:threonylcarbamoyladenosine tRNA methylthiotransferase CDKAL1